MKLGRLKFKNAICSLCSGNNHLFASNVFPVVLNTRSLIADDGGVHKTFM